MKRKKDVAVRAYVILRGEKNGRHRRKTEEENIWLKI